MAEQQATTQGRDPSHLISDVQGTVSAVERGDWVSAGLGMANTAMGIVGLAANPLSGFLSAGFSWAINHVSFLREPFDALLGSPESINKMSGAWLSASKQIEQIVADYRRTSVEETKGWRGKSADGYRAAAKKHASGLETLSKAAKGISDAAKGAGQLVATVRKTIMDLISQAVSDMVMKIIQWLAASFLTFGAAIAAAISDIVQMACNYAKKLADFLQKLGDSLKKLIDLIKSVGQIAQTAKQILQAITAMTHSNKGAGGANTRPSSGGLGLTDEQLRQMDQNARDRYVNGGVTNPSGGGGGGQGPSGPVVNRPPVLNGGGGSPTDPSGYPGGGWGPGNPSGPVVSRPPVVGTPDDRRYYPGIVPNPTNPTGPVVGRPPVVGNPGSGGSGGGTGGPGTGGGHWEPGKWVPDGGSSGGGGGGRVTPPYIPPGGSYNPNDPFPNYPSDRSGYTHTTNSSGSTPTIPPVRPYTAPDLTHTSGGGGGGGGGIPGGFGGGGGGGVPGGFGGGGGGAAGGTPTLQAGGASGVLPAGAGGGAPGAMGGAPGAAGAGRAGGGAGGMGMGMMPPMAGGGGQGDGKDHQRKVRIEGEPLIEDAPKAAKPIIGE